MLHKRTTKENIKQSLFHEYIRWINIKTKHFLNFFFQPEANKSTPPFTNKSFTNFFSSSYEAEKLDIMTEPVTRKPALEVKGRLIQTPWLYVDPSTALHPGAALQFPTPTPLQQATCLSSRAPRRQVANSVGQLGVAVHQPVGVGENKMCSLVVRPRGGRGTRRNRCCLISRLTGTCGWSMTVFMCGQGGGVGLRASDSGVGGGPCSGRL